MSRRTSDLEGPSEAFASLSVKESPPEAALDSTVAGEDPSKNATADATQADGPAGEPSATEHSAPPPRRRSSTLAGTGESALARVSTNCTVAQPFTPGPTAPVDPFAGKTIYDYQLLDCNHELYDLKQHRGHVVLIYNVASKCKEYSQKTYATLVRLYNKYRNRGLAIIAVPCNQFGGCETGNEDEIAENVPMLYSDVGDIDFPIMAKVDVNGDHELPLYAFLKARVKGTLGQSAIKWNFTGFLVDTEGNPIVRFAPGATMEEIEPRVLEALDGNTVCGHQLSDRDLAARAPTPPPHKSPERGAESSEKGGPGTSPDAGAQTASPGTIPSLGTSESPDKEETM